MVPWFWFVTKIMLITAVFCLLVSRAYTAWKLSIFATLSPYQVCWLCAKSWVGMQLGQLAQTYQRNTPCYLISCLAIIAVRKKEERGTFGVIVFVFPSNHYIWWSLAFLVFLAEHLPADGNQWISSLFCLACVWASLRLLNCFYLDPQIFLLLLFQFSSPSCWAGSHPKTELMLSCWPGPTHHTDGMYQKTYCQSQEFPSRFVPHKNLVIRVLVIFNGTSLFFSIILSLLLQVILLVNLGIKEVT